MRADRPNPQVRPRAPSAGRPAAPRTAPRRRIDARPAYREQARGYGGVRRTSGLPLAARLLLASAVVALGGVALLTASGGLTTFVAGLGATVGGAVSLVTATPSPTPIPSGPLGAPALTAPAEAYTNASTVEVSGQLPGVTVGQSGYRVRLYVTLPDQEPVLVADIAAPTTSYFTFAAVPLTKGANEFTATLVDPFANESEPSAPVRYVLDTSIPKIELASPAEGATVAGATVDLVGTTQKRSTIVVRNATNGATVSGTAAADGSFLLTIPIDVGRNAITITPTDPAGNVGSFELGITRSGAAMTASLRASAYRFSVAKLPQQLVLTATAIDATGEPVVGAQVTFSVSIPGIPVVTGEGTTDGTGTAVFQTTIPAGATPGSGPATAYITSDVGTASPRTVITIE